MDSGDVFCSENSTRNSTDISLISLIESCTRTVTVDDTLCGVPSTGSVTFTVTFSWAGVVTPVGARQRTDAPVPVNVPPSALHSNSSPLSGVWASWTVAVATTSSPTSAKLDGAFARVLWTTRDVMTGGGFGPGTTYV